MTEINGIPIPDEAMLADGFDGAVIGFVQFKNFIRVMYIYDECVEILVKDHLEWDYSDAVEWMEFNVVSAYVGPNTPVFLSASEMIEAFEGVTDP